MTSIKERAREFAEREYINNQYEKELLDFGYFHGATEQRKIDIAKACEWLKEHVRSAYINMGKCGLSECHVQEWWLEEFYKAMEE